MSVARLAKRIKVPSSTARLVRMSSLPTDSKTEAYVPPKVWEWKQGTGGKFANINRPIAGATSEKILPVGKHPFQLYSLATPNGVKVTVMLEELLHAGVKEGR